jgi:ribosomal protein L32
MPLESAICTICGRALLPHHVSRRSSG